MEYCLNLGAWNGVFAVPCAVVDQHIKLAGAAQLKVLLWVLRHAGQPFETGNIAQDLGMHPADVNDSMQYWLETGLLLRNQGELTPGEAPLPEREAAPAVNPAVQPAPVAAQPPVNTPAPEYIQPQQPAQQPAPQAPAQQEAPAAPARPRPLSRPQKPDSIYVARRMQDCKEIAFMMQEAQVILGRPISNGDSATLVMLHDNDGLPVDVILMILQYAVSINKNNMRYIEKMAVSWAAEEIDTLEKAERKIRSLTEGRQAWRLVERVIGIEDRSPTAKEEAAASRWVLEWGFDERMIREAYERCVDSKGKYSVDYTNRILERWHNEGISTLQQAHEEKSNGRRQRAEQERAPSYDIDAYERSSIFDDQKL